VIGRNQVRLDFYLLGYVLLGGDIEILPTADRF
jgi:hypothetical protein